MAVRLRDKENVDAPASPFIYGNVRDNPGDGTGTPANKATFADYLQFFERLMDIASVVFNGLPENLSNGFQYADALTAYITSFIAGARYEWESADSLKANIAQPAWIPITLKNSWTNRASTTFAYRFDTLGKIWFKGVPTAPSSGVNIAIADTPAALASLPALASGISLQIAIGSGSGQGHGGSAYFRINNVDIEIIIGDGFTPSASASMPLNNVGFWPDENT